MTAPVLRTQVSAALRRPGRLLLTGLSIAVAGFVVFSTILAYEITERTVQTNLSGTPSAADLVVGGLGQPRIAPATLDQITGLPGVAEAAGRVQAGLATGGSGGPYLLLRADPGSGPLATVRLVEGSYPHAAHELAITRRTADRLGLSVGTTVLGRTDSSSSGEPLRLTITGVVEAADDAGRDAYAPAGIVLAVDPTDGVEQIDVRLAVGATPSTVRQRIEAVLTAVAGQRPTVASGAEVRAREARDATDQIDTIFALVGMFIAVAVVAATLVATSTFRIIFAQRMRQLALLRAVGAGRLALVRALAAEGVLTGLVTGTVGVATALALGHALPPVLRLFGRQIASPGYPLPAAVAVVLGTVLVTVLAVVAPAFSAARVAPLAALRAASTRVWRPGIGPARLVTGLLLAVGAALLAYAVVGQLPKPGQDGYSPFSPLLQLVASVALAFMALVALGPALVRPILAVVGWPLRHAGPIGRLAVGGVGGAARRAATVCVVVALGGTLTVGVLVGGVSLQALSDREVALQAPADIEVSAETGTDLPAEVVARARGSAELAHVTPYRRVQEITLARDGASAGGENAQVVATDLDLRALPTADKLVPAQGSVAELGPGRAVVAGWFASGHGLHIGETINLSHAGRTTVVRLVAILPDGAPLSSDILIDRADLDRLGYPAVNSGLLADSAHPGERGRAAAVRALRQAIAGADNLALNVLADERDQVNRLLDALMGIAIGLVGLTVLVAVAGVGSTTALSVVERIRECGLLRAVGLSRGGLGLMLTVEAGLYGLIGAAVGLVLGVPYAWLAVKALGTAAPLILPVAPLTGLFVALIALTALAGVLPARSASRVSPVAALGTDS